MKVLVPLDGSRLSDAVLPHVRRLLSGAASACELHLLHVVHEAADARTEARAEARAHLAAYEDLLTAEGFRVRPRVVPGDPVQEILEHVVDDGIDLVAMATHGRSGVRRWVRGSVAERVLRGCPAPLLLVNPRGVLLEDDDVRYRRVLVPLVAGIAPAAAAARTIADLAAAAGAEVLLLRSGGPGPTTDPVPALQSLLRDRGVTDVSVLEGQAGAPSRAILAAATAVSPDLIALCAGARSGLSPWPLEAVVERVTRHAPCPVLVLPLGAAPALTDPRRHARARQP